MVTCKKCKAEFRADPHDEPETCDLKFSCPEYGAQHADRKLPTPARTPVEFEVTLAEDEGSVHGSGAAGGFSVGMGRSMPGHAQAVRGVFNSFRNRRMIDVQSKRGGCKPMTYNANHQESAPMYNNPKDAICFDCGRPLDGASVRYDGYAHSGKGGGHSIYMHTVCASEMAQRLICDAWPNRRTK